MNNEDYLQTQQKKFDKGFVVGLIICIVICSVMTFTISLIRISSFDKDVNYLLVLTDGFTVSGGLMCLFYLLVFVSDEGAFDILSYSIKLVWNVTFHKNVRETNLPKTYTEYRALKRSKPRSNLKFMLYSGLLFLLIGIVLWIIYANY